MAHPRVAPWKWSSNWDSFVPQVGGSAIAGKREKPEEIVSKLRQVEVLQVQRMTISEAVRQIGVTQQAFYRWRKLYGGMGRSQLQRLKELEKE
ncbi:Transposase, partial [Aliiroseovarius crassostreae]